MKRLEVSKIILDKYKYRTGQKDFIGGNPVTLEAKDVSSLWKQKFNVTPKVDGTRYLCLMEGESGLTSPYFIDRGTGALRVFQPIHSSGESPTPRTFPNCILDGEIVEEKTGGRTRWIFWVFDILSFKGVMVNHLSFNQRYSIIINELALTEKASPDPWLIMLAKPYYNAEYFINEKDVYVSIYKLFREHCKKLKLKKPTLDGLIFNDTIRPYVKGPWKRCDNVQYKWKPKEEQTIDVQIKNRKYLDSRGNPYSFKMMKNNKEYTIGLNKPDNLPSSNPKTDVAELRVTKVDRKKGIDTEFVRWRTDKNANAKLTMDSVINGYLRPVDLKDLFSRNPKNIIKYMTHRQLAQLLNRNKLFTPELKKTLRETLKSSTDKVSISFPNKTLGLQCIAERGFPTETITEVTNSKGQFLKISEDILIPRIPGKKWVPKETIKIGTDYIYKTPVLIHPEKLMKDTRKSPNKKQTITKTIFRVTAYTNIIFENDNNYYIESFGGEKLTTLLKIIKMFLAL